MKYIFQVLVVVVVTFVTSVYGQSQVEFTNQKVERVDQLKENEDENISQLGIWRRESLWKAKAYNIPEARKHLSMLSVLYSKRNDRTRSLLKPSRDIATKIKTIQTIGVRPDSNILNDFK